LFDCLYGKKLLLFLHIHIKSIKSVRLGKELSLMTAQRFRLLATASLTTLLVFAFLLPSCEAQEVGDRVLLVERAIGVPGHPAPGNPGVSHRLPGGTTVTVRARDPSTGWYQIEDDVGNTAWITRTYIERVVTGGAAPSDLCYTVGTWNLEHFHDGKNRGFPETLWGGPSYPARTANDLTALAAVIRDSLDAKILILNEVMGEEREVEGELHHRSEEMDDLLAQLGPSFQYVITQSGRAQRVVLLYDTRYVRLNAAAEIEIPRIVVQGSDIFYRDPLIGHFTFLYDGEPKNDLLVVGLHLISDQEKTRNHDAAMARLLRELDMARADGTVLPTAEFDILLGGDLNASRYDNDIEQFFTDLDTGNWKVLAGDIYPATRLSGVPLEPRSQIDYLIVTRNTPEQSGLLGEEISTSEASVHQELAQGDWQTFRRVFSDHFPVTTCVRVTEDND
jgi:endonuclease/exonuclease/phosphatase family metal-dependent hydrolase